MTSNDTGMLGPSIQERYFPEMTCFGCGPANAKGLRLRSFEDDDGTVVATFLPWPEHDNGLGFLNGGIICTLLDCHSAAAALTEADRRGFGPTPELPLPMVTAGLDVRYLRPAPLAGPVELRASVSAIDEAQAVVDVALWAEGKERAAGSALWKRWRPRT
jgi:acyl-coenzyme A thioesterase PaaI-like protein